MVAAILTAHTHPQRARLPMGGEPLLYRMVRTLTAIGASPILVTVSEADAALSADLCGLPVSVLKVAENTDMFSAIRQCIAALPEAICRVFISPVSIPTFSESLLTRMLACDRPVCRPVRGGIGLHPVLLDRNAFETIAAYRGVDGLRGALRTFPENEICRLSLDDMNTGLHPEVQVRIADHSPFFGPGPRQLLLGIRARGSVAHACETVGLSYSKGRALLRRMEEALGTPLVSRTQGGSGGGSASLTPAGERFLAQYAAYEQAVSDYAAALFSDYFPKDTITRETEESPV